MSRRSTKDEAYMSQALMQAMQSKDTSTTVGCCLVNRHNLVIGTGYNGMARGINDDVPARHERPEKYAWMAHAEENTLNMCLSDAIGGTIYVSGLPPCPQCARMMIQRGVARVVHWPMRKGSSWEKPCAIAREMLLEAGVKVEVFQGGLTHIVIRLEQLIAELAAHRSGA